MGEERVEESRESRLAMSLMSWASATCNWGGRTVALGFHKERKGGVKTKQNNLSRHYKVRLPCNLTSPCLNCSGTVITAINCHAQQG